MRWRVFKVLLFFVIGACGASSFSSLSVAPVETPSTPVGVCGDGVRNEGEVCDDGARHCRVDVGLCFQCVRCAGRILVRNRPGVPEQNDPTVWPPTLPTQQICSARYANGDTAETTYDERGRPLSYQRAGQYPQLSNFVYEADERRQQFDSDGDGNLDLVLWDRIDTAGRSVASEMFLGPTQFSGGITRSEFGEHGALRSTQEQNGVISNTTEYSYDSLGRLTHAVSTNGERFEYRYEDVRRVESRHLSQYGGDEGVSRFEYDARGLLLVIHHETPGRETRWTYDEQGAVLTQVDIPLLHSTSYHYTYDGPRVLTFEGRRVSEEGAEHTERHRFEYEGTQVRESVDVEGSVPGSVYSRFPPGHSENRFERGCLARFEEFLPE